MKASLLMEPYVFYSCLTLFAMGCSALTLSIFFRLKSKALNGLPKNLSANVFNKTFIVFNPYAEKRKIIHSFLSVFPFLVSFASLGFALALLILVEAGLMLSLFMILIGLNLIVMEDAPEVYQNSRSFVKAVEGRSNLGVGDLRVFQIMKRLVPKLSNYYLGLTITFITFSVMLPYIWSSLLSLFTQFIGLILQVSASTGAGAWLVAVFLFNLTIFIIQIFASIIKSKLLGYVMESPTSEAITV